MAAVVVVLFVRYYIVEIFKIPTGSMAETLFGIHVRIDCPRCGWSYAIGGPGEGSDAADFAGRVSPCPSCGAPHRIGDFPVHGGHKILANKWITRIREPRRWEVLVFRFFDARKKPVNYIKRLVGLPGERIEIRGGDLYVDGRLSPKPWEVQDAVWIPVYDSRNENAWLPGWEGGGGGEGWGGWEWRFGETPERISYARSVANTIVYNPAIEGIRRAGEAVGDLRLSFSARLEGSRAWLEAELQSDDQVATVRLDRARPGALTVVHREGGRTTATWTIPHPLAADRPIEVDFVRSDGRLRLVLDGRTVWTEELPGREASQGRSSGVAFSGAGGGTLWRVRIARDIYYTPNGLFRFDIPEGEYFFLGDNSTNSNDSRTWNNPALDQIHTVARDRILGVASVSVLYLEFDWPWRIPWRRITFGWVR